MPLSRFFAALAGAAALVVASAAAASAGPAADAARDHLQKNKKLYGLTGADLAEVAVSSEVVSAHNGITHVYLQQTYRGIEVHNGIFTVNVRPDGSVLSGRSRFVSNLASLAGGQSARKGAVEAARAAARDLNLPPGVAIRALDRKGGPDEATTLSGGGISARPIEAKLVWLPLAGGLRLTWRVDIEEPRGDHYWLAFVDAETGETLAADDLVVHDEIAATAAAVSHPSGPPSGAAAFPDLDGSSYRVFAIPFESPNDGDRTLVTGAADPAASPFGWHDTDGAAGPEFTVTRGNNAHAYTDLNADNVPDPGSDPDGGPGLDFDFALDLTQGPETYRPFAVTNLFYWNNLMHDITAGYGFDAAAGNFQVNNYGAGGLGNDDVRAEAQDGSGTNNANFFTPVEGQRPRMQMFIWTHPLPNTVSIASGGAAGDYDASRASFGPQLQNTGPITAAVALANDGVGTTSDACEPLVGFPAGAIAILDRGACEFGVKVLNAEQAGAVAAIVVNNGPGAPATMGPGAVGNQVTIPSVMVSLADGTLMKDNLPLVATLKANPVNSVSRDSDLDAGVICHEYGHGVSNRLTGGPTVPGCLSNAEQMGEGWSDWWAITLTGFPSDTRLTQRGVGNYVTFAPREGDGIRPTPYSTDMAVNPSTYASVADPAISQPHGIGYVWNTMLWEMYWNLTDRYGYNPDVYDPWDTGGNNLALQLVVDGMKFQPCRPGFVDGRDAILDAEMALTGGANQCEIWRAFAKRGLGASASQGLSSNRFDGVEAFDLPPSCTTMTFGGFLPPVQPPPAVNVRDAGDVVPVRFTVTGGEPTLDSQPVDCTTFVPIGVAPTPVATVGGARPRGGQYHLNWLTDASWAGTCRRLTVRVNAAEDGIANFRFE